MYQYIFQFRQMCIATTQINLTIKHIFFITSTTIHNSKFVTSNKGIPSFVT